MNSRRTAGVSLRELEARKAEIERELARVQQELAQRERLPMAVATAPAAKKRGASKA